MVERFITYREAPKTAFEPGHIKKAGRPAGTPNAITKVLKDAVMLAGDLAGEFSVSYKVVGSGKTKRLVEVVTKGKGQGLVNYLRSLAIHHPALYVSLLLKLMPMQLKATLENDNTNTIIHKFSGIDLSKCGRDELNRMYKELVSAKPSELIPEAEIVSEEETVE